MTQQQSRIGQQLGHYRLLSLLGSGGFADVYLSEHVHLHTQAAVKILNTRLAEADIEAFRREAQMVAFLQHPSIVRVLDFGVEQTIPYLAMDYAPNGSLRDRYPKGTVVPIPEIAPILIQVASALQYAHDQRLIHRDIKPENMLLGRNSEVLLSDFGIALVTQSSHLQSAQDIAGTITYMAPEQIQAHPRPASDQYALGVVAYEWLCGQRPFQGSYTEIAIKHTLTPPPPLREQIPHLPTNIEQVIMRALQKDPQQRFDNVITFAQTFAQAAQSFIQSQDATFIPAPPTSPSQPSSRSAQFMYPVRTSSNLPIATSNPTLLHLSSTQPFQENFTSSPPSQSSQPGTPPSTIPSSPSMNRPHTIMPAPNTPLYPVSPTTSSTSSYSTSLSSAQYQSAEQNFQSQQVHKPSLIARRSFIGGSIDGLVIAGSVGAGAVGTWLYFQRTMGTPPPAGAQPAGNLPAGSQPKPTGSGALKIGADAATPLLTYSGHHGIVYSISWSPDGAYIASGSQDGECQVWTADKGKLIFSIHSTLQPPISDDFVQSIVWSRHNPPRIAIGFVDGTLQILDINNRQRTGSLAKSYATNGVLSWSPDEKYLAVCTNIIDHNVIIYEVATWNIVTTYQEHTDSVHVVAWSPDGNYVASGSQDTTIRVWEPLSGKTRMIYKEHSGNITAINWSNDSTKIVSTAQDYVVRIWQPEQGNTLYTHQYPHQAPMGKVAWSHNNQFVAVYPGMGTIDILDAQLTVKQTLRTGVTYDLSWSPDDTRIATANYDNIAQIWHVGT